MTGTPLVIMPFAFVDPEQEIVKLDLKGHLALWQKKEHVKLLADRNYHPLTMEQVQGVEKFLFFTGYPRSGHSIAGSLLDAHPNIMLSYAFYLFRGVMQGSIEYFLRNKTAFFEILHEKSYHYSKVSGSKSRKGYTLDVPGLWSGKFDGKLKVIGDKSAMPTSVEYNKSSSSSWYKDQFDHLCKSVGVPVVGLHVVRNPFDMISTHTMYRALGRAWKRKETKWTPENKYRNDGVLESVVKFYLMMARAVHEMVPFCGMTVLEVHNEDFIQNPRRELQRLCKFLDVDCPEGYLEVCEKKTYNKISRTRDLIYWPLSLKQTVEEAIKKYPFFRGYSFEEDFYHH